MDHTNAAVLTAKRDLLHLTWRQAAAGTATEADVEEAAVDFTTALEHVAMARLRGMR